MNCRMVIERPESVTVTIQLTASIKVIKSIAAALEAVIPSESNWELNEVKRMFNQAVEWERRSFSDWAPDDKPK